MPQKVIVKKDYHNSRFDRWFKANIIDLPQSLIQKILRLNKVKINRKKVKTSYRVQLGDIVEIYDISKFKISTRPKIIKYKPSRKEVGIYDDYILENNNNFMVINKPRGIAVQAGTKSFRNIIDVLKDSKYFENTKPYIVHRLDKETSGVLIIAKNREYAQLFTSLFRIRKIHKTYIALTHGKVSKDLKTLKDDLITIDNGKKIFPNRNIQSVYFDNKFFDMYNDSEEGVLPRKKVRMRNYPDKDKKGYNFETKISTVVRDKKQNLIPQSSTINNKSSNIFGSLTGIISTLASKSVAFICASAFTL